MPKKILIALKPAMLEEMDHIAKLEHRTRSDLIREALRRYADNFRRTSSAVNHLSVAPSSNGTDARQPSAADTFANPRSNIEQRTATVQTGWTWTDQQSARTGSPQGLRSDRRDSGTPE
jgi:Arc/MetJ-type ribon-helix-helix transcriptional regulator